MILVCLCVSLSLLQAFSLMLFWIVFKKDASLVKRLKNIHKISEQAIDDGTMLAFDRALIFIVRESNFKLKNRNS